MPFIGLVCLCVCFDLWTAVANLTSQAKRPLPYAASGTVFQGWVGETAFEGASPQGYKTLVEARVMGFVVRGG